MYVILVENNVFLAARLKLSREVNTKLYCASNSKSEQSAFT